MKDDSLNIEHIPIADIEKSAEEVAIEEELRKAQREMQWEMAKTAVDIAGIADPTPISDGIGAAMSLWDGDLIGAGLSLLSMVPYAGDALAKTAKGKRAAETLFKLSEKAAKLTTKLNNLKTVKKIRNAESAKKISNFSEKIKETVISIKETTDKSIKSLNNRASAVVGCAKTKYIKNKLNKAYQKGRGYKPKLKPNWKKKVAELPEKERQAILIAKKKIQKEWLAKEKSRLGRDLNKDEIRSIIDKVDSFDWTQPDKIKFRPVKEGEVFNRSVNKPKPNPDGTPGTPGSSDFLTPKNGEGYNSISKKDVIEGRALPDTNDADLLAEFEAQKDFEVLEGPIDGGNWVYSRNDTNDLTGVPRKGGGTQSVVVGDHKELLKHNNISTELE